MTTQGSDRRRNDRKALRVGAELLFQNFPPLPVRVLDVSSGGAGILATANLPARARCTIRFSVPASPPKGSAMVEAQVEVVHSILSGTHGGFVVGLQFTSLPPASSEAIASFLRGI